MMKSKKRHINQFNNQMLIDILRPRNKTFVAKKDF